MAFFGGATLVVMIALFLVLLIRHRNKSVLGTGLAGRQAQEPVEDRESIKRQVVADLYGEIKGRIEKYEIAKIESDVRERVQCEMRAEVMADLTDEDRAAIVREIEEEERQARRQEIAETKKDELYQEAYALALDDALSRLKKKERQRLKTEALQELVNAVEQEIKSEHEAVLRKKALCNLEERVQREVEIKERTRLTLKVREELRARLEKEVENEEVALFRRQVRKKIRKSISEPLDAVAMVTDANAEDAPDMVKRVPLSSATMDLHKGSESEALVSLAKTVSMLKKQYESSTLFKLNEAQTAAMIDYLEKISNRLNGYFTEVNDGIEQAVFGNEQDSLGTYAGKRGKFLHDESAAGHDRPDNRIEFKYPTDSRDLRTGTDE